MLHRAARDWLAIACTVNSFKLDGEPERKQRAKSVLPHEPNRLHRHRTAIGSFAFATDSLQGHSVGCIERSVSFRRIGRLLKLPRAGRKATSDSADDLEEPRFLRFLDTFLLCPIPITCHFAADFRQHDGSICVTIEGMRVCQIDAHVARNEDFITNCR